MNARATTGFTIIETMLFLGVSGILMIGVLATSAYGINQQRYRDSVESLRGYLQEQYSLVANVENGERPADAVGCSSDARVSDSGIEPTPRGRSDCVIVGRYLATTDGATFTASDVVAYRPASATLSSTNAIDELRSYSIRVNDRSSTEYEVNWGARITAATSTDGRGMALLIIRTPDSGTIKTFSVNNSDAVTNSDLATTIIPDASAQNEQLICVRPANPVGSPVSAIRISAFASNQSAVEVIGEGRC